MDAYQAIISKRDTRAFDPERTVSRQSLQRILQAGRMAGSSKNTQPCRFVVLQSQEMRERIAGCGDFAKHVPAAPLVIAVVLLPDGGPFDAGRAAQNMMVAAWAEGISSCPTSMHNMPCAQAVLGLPEDHRVAILLPFGYPLANNTPRPGRQRLPLEELTHWEHWGERDGGND